MRRRQKSNRRADPKELLELVERSGLRPGEFARLLGLPRTTLLAQMHGPSAPSGAVLNGARFVMLRLGHAVEIEPVVGSFLRRRPVESKCVSRRRRADRTSHAGQ